MRRFAPPPLLWSLAAAHSQSARITPRSDLQGSNFEVQMGENIISTGLTPDPVAVAGLPDAPQRFESSASGDLPLLLHLAEEGRRDHDCTRWETEQPYI